MNRFGDIDCSFKRLPPVYGFRSTKLVSLQEALQPIEPQIDQLAYYVKTAKKHCNYPNKDGLSKDQSASIYIYTMEWGETTLYRVLNEALRAENRQALKIWFPYLKLFDTALDLLPTVKESVWRGVPLDIGKNFTKNQIFTWWSVSSCSSSVNVIETFLQNKSNSTLFLIEVMNGKKVSGYTEYEAEDEIILRSGTEFSVKSNPLRRADGSHTVHLIEINDGEDDNDDNSKQSLAIAMKSLDVKPKVSQTGKKFAVGSFKVSDQPSEAPKYGPMRSISSQNLPPSVDLRPSMTPIENQLRTNASVANALAGAYEYLIMKKTGKHIDVSRLFIYYNSRQIDGLQSSNMRDAGTTITSAIKALAEYGCCEERLFPYDESLINQQPPQQCYEDAKKHRVASSMSINANLDEMKACLAEGYPFAFGLKVCQSFVQADSNNGHVPTPAHYELHNEQHSGHALLAVGYSDASQCFIVRNSWGSNWGDRGYCYIPYGYMANPELCRDLHAIKAITGY